MPNDQLVAWAARQQAAANADSRGGAPADSIVPARVAETALRKAKRLYARRGTRLPFHGWHHVRFVRDKGMEFAALNGSDVRLVGVAALVHDMNYLVQRGSSATAGRYLRMNLLARSGASVELARRVDRVVCEAEMSSRHSDISLEAQALSDADTLFKALPITPVLLAHRYLAENRVSLRSLADKINREQQGAFEQGFYFYNPDLVARYSQWALVNLRLWRHIAESLDDPYVEELVGAIDSALL